MGCTLSTDIITRTSEGEDTIENTTAVANTIENMTAVANTIENTTAVANTIENTTAVANTDTTTDDIISVLLNAFGTSHVEILTGKKDAELKRVQKEHDILIDQARREEKNRNRRIILENIARFHKVNTLVEFNDWWQLYLKMYDTIVKDEHNSYYSVCSTIDKTGVEEISIKEISILNSLTMGDKQVDVNQITYLKNITFNRCVMYLYVNIKNGDTYIYHQNKWTEYKE